MALVTPDKEKEAIDAGADFAGLDEYLQKIKEGWTDVDVIVIMPSVMGKIGPLGKVLGPRGLMPNPKTGTVTMDISKAVSDVVVKLTLGLINQELSMPQLEKFLLMLKKYMKIH